MISFEEFKNQLTRQYTTDEIRAFYSLVSESTVIPADLVERLLNDEPIQYILGYSWFYNRRFHVDPSVLIPRPETEELCERITGEIRGENVHILDIGTGSGCIAITLLCENENATATAIDISENALSVSSDNAKLHGVSSRIKFLNCDFLINPFPSGTYNLIVSNPPYIDRKELNQLSKNVREFEPYKALFPPGRDPLIFYRRIREYLDTIAGPYTLWLEINQKLGAETLRIFQEAYNAELIRDFSSNWRFIKIKKET